MEKLRKLLEENGYYFEHIIIGEENFLIVAEKQVEYYSEDRCGD